MRNQGDWRLPLREHQHAPTADMIVAMMRSLYRGHVDRHGRDDYRDVTHEEASVAVALAATLGRLVYIGGCDAPPGRALSPAVLLGRWARQEGQRTEGRTFGSIPQLQLGPPTTATEKTASIWGQSST
jgi:hypothetical protein